MTRLFTIHEIDDETSAEHIYVYTLGWRPDWGAPMVMFAPVDDPVYAAAPELLRAAKALSEEAYYDGIEPEFTIDPQTLAELDAAIAQAEGGAR